MTTLADIFRQLDAVLAAVAQRGERLDRIEARFDATGEAAPAVVQWTTAKGAACELHVSPDTVLRRARAIGCAHEFGRLVLVPDRGSAERRPQVRRRVERRRGLAGRERQPGEMQADRALVGRSALPSPVFRPRRRC
jgi:hypothetical protein